MSVLTREEDWDGGAASPSSDVPPLTGPMLAALPFPFCKILSKVSEGTIEERQGETNVCRGEWARFWRSRQMVRLSTQQDLLKFALRSLSTNSIRQCSDPLWNA